MVQFNTMRHCIKRKGTKRDEAEAQAACEIRRSTDYASKPSARIPHSGCVRVDSALPDVLTTSPQLRRSPWRKDFVAPFGSKNYARGVC
jgi:hypothetical protein